MGQGSKQSLSKSIHHTCKAWIEEIPELGLGKFDFIECSGVLHHLKVCYMTEIAQYSLFIHQPLPLVNSLQIGPVHFLILSFFPKDKKIGLNILAGALTADGGMGIMVYTR